MSQSRKSGLKVLSGDEKRLLEHLAQPGAYGWLTDRPGAHALAITGRRNGVSVQIASGSATAAQQLESAGLARWEGAEAARKRLFLTDSGRAHLARMGAGDDVDPFQAQHATLGRRRLNRDGEQIDVVVNTHESPLAWLAVRKGRNGKALVDAASVEAGERFRRDFTFAQIMPRTTASWSAAPSDSAYRDMTYSDVVIAARQRVDHALDAVGPEFSGVLMDVCGFLKGLEAIESERGWPARSGKVVLCLALSRLARHYGYGVRAEGRPKVAMRH